MADVKVSAMPADASPTTDDLIMTIDTGSGANKRVTLAELAALVSANISPGSISATEIDYTTGGEVWWEELGRAIGPTSGTLEVNGFASKKFLRVFAIGIATGGVLDTGLTFNNDTGNNYAWRHSVNFGAVVDNASSAAIAIESGQTDSGQMNSFFMDITNVAAQEKSYSYQNISQDAAGAANLTANLVGLGKWANTSAAITRINWNETGAGTFATGSILVVLGHD